MNRLILDGQPLTAFEQREADRQQAIRDRIAAFNADLSETVATLAERIGEIEAMPIDESWQEFAAEAAQAKDAALVRARAALKVSEASEKAEQERLAAEKRARQEREAQIRREAAELTLCGVTADQAHAIVVSIARGSIPYVSINYCAAVNAGNGRATTEDIT